MTTTFKYITIIEESYSGKTRKFTVKAVYKKVESILGEVYWEGNFVKGYAFYPWEVVLDANELIEIASFIKGLMQERKLANQSKPSNWAHEGEGDKGKYSTNQ